jgi:hypothetical protein
MIGTGPIRQIAYFVADVKAAARAHHAQFGSGPYFVAEHIPLKTSLHRGASAPVDHSSAYGQWGDLMIEFVQQNNSGPSAFHDMYPQGSGRYGMHHVAVFTDKLSADIKRFNADGHETALYAEMMDGFAFAMMDCVATLGHMVELYAPVPKLTGFYAFVKKAADGYAGGEIIHSITFDQK